MKSRFAVLAPLLAVSLILPAGARAQSIGNPAPPVDVWPVLECIEIPQFGNQASLAVNINPLLLHGWTWLSYYSTHTQPVQKVAGTNYSNYLLPDQFSYPYQPSTFQPGYVKASFAVQNAGPTPNGPGTYDLIWDNGGFWQVSNNIANWTPRGTQVTPSKFGSYIFDPTVNILTPAYSGSLYCPASLLPANPVITGNGTATHQLLATLASMPAPGTAVTVQVRSLNNLTFDQYVHTYPDYVTNVQYSNGSIYGDISFPAGKKAVGFAQLVLSVNGNTLAFGHVPLFYVPNACSATIGPGALASGSLNAPYSQSISVTPTGSYNLNTTGQLPSGLSLTGSTLSGTPSTVGSFPFSIVATSADGSCGTTQNYTLNITGAACGTDITSQIAISFSGLSRNLATGQWSETVTLQNTGSTAVAGPLSLVVESLSANATLTNSAGFTSCVAPSGTPYVSAGNGLGAGQSIAVALTFTNSQPSQSITFTPRVVAGGSQL